MKPWLTNLKARHFLCLAIALALGSAALLEIGFIEAIIAFISVGVASYIAGRPEQNPEQPEVVEPVTDEKRPLRGILSHGKEVTHRLAERHEELGFGFDQVKSILADAVADLSTAFADLDSHISGESDFISELGNTVRTQLGRDSEAGICHAAENLRIVIQGAVEQFETIMHRGSDIGSTLAELGESTDKMLALLDESREIRDATIVLALNAGIEAQKAGEAGRAFAVIATEMRGLSAQAEEFNSELEKLLSQAGEEMRLAREAVVEITDCDVGPAVQSIQQLDDLVNQVSESGSRTAEGLDRVEHSHSVVLGSISTAVRALQFEDMTRQRVDSLQRQVLITGQAGRDAWRAVQQGYVGAPPGEPIEHTDQQVSAEILSILESLGSTVDTTVSQTSVEAGTVQLF